MMFEFSTAAERAAVGCAVVSTGVETGLELDSFSSTGLLVSNGAVDFGASSDFLVSSFFFLVSNGTSCLLKQLDSFNHFSFFSFIWSWCSEAVAEL